MARSLCIADSPDEIHLCMAAKRILKRDLEVDLRDIKMFDLTGKTALLTGGSRGLGFQIASGYLEHGARHITGTCLPVDGGVSSVLG